MDCRSVGDQLIEMGKKLSGANINGEQCIYEDFDPYCRWHSDKEKDIIKIELKGTFVLSASLLPLIVFSACMHLYIILINSQEFIYGSGSQVLERNNFKSNYKERG